MKNRIALLRRKKQLTQLEVADCLGISKAAVAQYESGKTQNIKTENLLRLSQLLNASPSYIMGWSCIQNEPEGEEIDIIEGYRRLNSAGKSQLKLRLWELSKISDYTNDIIDVKDEDYLSPIAAHADNVSVSELKAEVERIKGMINSKREG